MEIKEYVKNLSKKKQKKNTNDFIIYSHDHLFHE